VPFEDLTLEQLRAATKEQIITKIMEKLKSMTKGGICEFIWTIKNIVFEDVRLETLTVKHNVPKGHLLRAFETTDILGNKLGSRRIEWTYYPTHEVDTITISELDANDQVISTKTIKHFTDGRQPAVLT
jgi:hypothetical protein